MALTDNIKNFLSEHKLSIVGTAVGAAALAGFIGLHVANATARHRLPSDLVNNATVLDEKVIGNTKYMLIIHHDDYSARKYWTGRPNCMVLVESYDDGSNREIKSTHYQLSDRETEGFILPPMTSTHSEGVR